MKKNPYLAGKIAKRKRARQQWMERQLKPKVKYWDWAHRFQFCPHLGLKLALKQEFLDASTEACFLYKVWG